MQKADIKSRQQWLFKWREPLGRKECPYAYRWIAGCPWFSLRLHHWVGSDDQRALHDHPWGFVTLILKGGYTDVNPVKNDKLKAGSIRFRPAEYKHAVLTDPGGCWSFVITGPVVRLWGFWVKQPDTGPVKFGSWELSKTKKFIRANKYFLKYGKPACE